ncbi:MAG: glycosyltransferase [Chryseobacterium sp.]|jgi:glycosyltransferase involved in cell wall biosynthesis|uniref:glycosyltransferase n=1 Tax=Chryseobacterium sp. TaxID=1871047 RepID=UPI00281B6C59|nr:glycosyltransferase [Chryseobacterium sp.]MDR2236275.1 glycosyltransferase [Chryseobacterium sp.]
MTSSVALCTYNGEHYIAEQLDSILNQTLPVSEIIICDDRSSDRTPDIVKGYAQKYPDLIKVYENPENLGYVGNFEKAMSLCTGDLVFLCDQDDRWYSHKNEYITQFFKAHHKINIVTHNIKLFGETVSSDEKTTYWDIESVHPEEFKDSRNIIKRILYQGNVFPGMSMVIRNTFLKAHLPLKKIKPVIIHDYELLLMAADQDTVWVEKSILGEYRIHPQQNIGFQTFSKFSTSGKSPITREKLFTVFQRNSFVKETVLGLRLDPSLQNGYKDYCLRSYRNYLESLSLLQRFIVQVKMKYYFHIFDYLK